MINRETAYQFLTALYGNHIPDDSRLVISWGESGKAITQHRWESDLDAAIAVAMSKADTHNVYYGINLRDAKAERNGIAARRKTFGISMRFSLTLIMAPKGIRQIRAYLTWKQL